MLSAKICSYKYSLISLFSDHVSPKHVFESSAASITPGLHILIFFLCLCNDALELKRQERFYKSDERG